MLCLLLTGTGGSTALAGLDVVPSEVVLEDSFARRQLLVESDGRDVTRTAEYSIADETVARVDETGHVVPVAAGTTVLTVSHQGTSATVPLRVSRFDGQRSVDFATQIMPLLSRLGCNSGGCHGKASGQNGFKLSLFGFDAAFDYDAIVSEARGRRVFAAAPGQSLLLQKATGASPHGGGKRLETGSENYRIFSRWIASGVPASAPDVPRVASLEVVPAERIMKRGVSRQLAVLAKYTDGSIRDVTRETQFSSNLDVVATVADDGLVTTGGSSGEAAIMARYMGEVSVFRVLVPHGSPLDSLPGFEPAGEIDRLTAARWMKLGLEPSPVCDDSTFIRRVTVDLCGRLPTTAEVESFLANSSPHRREELVDRLLDSPDYPAFFALRWGTILRNSRLAGADQAAYAFHNWLKDMIARNRPYDEFVRGIVAAAGEWQDAPAINWYWQMRDDQLHQVTADTAQVFLGIRLQCARCHHHPYERWGQADYYGLAGFFTRLGRKSFGQPPPYFASSRVTTGEKNPLTGKVPEPRFPDGEAVEFTPEDDPRHALVDWMAEPENPFFAKALVNRMWGHFFARGLVDEVDDLRETNPPSNPELLDWLAADFVAHKFDVRHVIRSIVTSRTYQLSSVPAETNQDDRQNFARYYARRLYAEVLLDGVDAACGTETKFSGISSSARAVDLPHEGFGSYFLDTFDRPRRVSGCECERSSGATLAQVLLLSNSQDIEGKVSSETGRIASLFKAETPTSAAVEQLYLAALSRRPTEAELQTAGKYIDESEKRRLALEDVLWSLLNTREFMFNH
ncbi:MAG: DUF1553 domain-containing protein [Planctomycetaceae bacterium]|nr:DUF1553 domain-containing protein [Planctomycetaceae bacterium]